MRFIKTRPSGKDKDVMVYEFTFGKEELKLLLKICAQTRKTLPDIFEHTIIRHRLNNIIKEFGNTLKKLCPKNQQGK